MTECVQLATVDAICSNSSLKNQCRPQVFPHRRLCQLRVLFFLPEYKRPGYWRYTPSSIPVCVCIRPMNTQLNPYLPAVGEPASSSSSNSPLSSIPTSPSSSQVSTPASSVLELPKEVPRNPHDFPVFDKDSLTNPSEPILYLPPFLSSLPHTLVNFSSPTSTGRAPKATEAHLPDIDGPSLALHKALHNFTPITEKYASTSYAEAFNWGDLDLPEEDEHEWYCVAFRSIRKPGSENGC